MSNLEVISYRHRVLQQWAATVRRLGGEPSWATNRRRKRAPGSKVITFTVPAQHHRRISAVRERWGLGSTTRAAQVALMLGLLVMEGTVCAPDPRLVELLRRLLLSGDVAGGGAVDLGLLLRLAIGSESDT